MNKLDTISIIVIAIMLTCVVIAVIVYYNYEQRECIAEPLMYAAKQLEDQYGYEFYGDGMFLVDPNMQSPRVFFSSKEVKIE